MLVFKREHATVIYRNLNIEDDNFLMQQQNQGQNTQRGVLDENKKKGFSVYKWCVLKRDTRYCYLHKYDYRRSFLDVTKLGTKHIEESSWRKRKAQVLAFINNISSYKRHMSLSSWEIWCNKTKDKIFRGVLKENETFKF